MSSSTLPQPLTSNPPPSVENTILSFPSPHILLVTLSRPKALNAITRKQHWDMDALWKWYDAESWLRCAVITGEGRAFCAGADLKEWLGRLPSSEPASNDSSDGTSNGDGNDSGDDSIKQNNAPSSSLPPTGFAALSNRTGKKPILAAVNGLCLGGGMEMILNCDIVLASSNARFGLPEVKRGVIALGGALARLVRTVGLQRAGEMSFMGRDGYGAWEMGRWGVVNCVVGEDSHDHDGNGGDKVREGDGGVVGGVKIGVQGGVVGEAIRWAEEIAGNSPDSVIVTKEGLKLGWEGVGPDVATGILERGMYGRMDGGENMVEGVRSWVEKRGARWVGSKL